MACFFIPYFLASFIWTIAYIEQVQAKGRLVIWCVLDVPVLIAIPFLASAFKRLSKLQGALLPVSKKQILLQMTANSLFALFSPFIALLQFPTVSFVVYDYFCYFFEWFGLMVLVQTMCELTDLFVPLEMQLRLDERYSTYRESS